MASSAGRNDKVHPASANPTFSAEDGKAANQPRPSHRFRVESIMEPSEADVAERSNIIRQQSSSANAQLQVEPTDAQLENIDINESTDNTVRYSIGTEHHELNKQNFPEIAIDNGLLNLCHAETLEKTPVIDFYLNSIDIERNMMARPSIDTLIHGKPMFPIVSVELNRMKSYNSEIIDVEDLEKYTSTPTSAGRVKFGWIEGVFVRCLLNILGVMLYLRISWVAGQAGIAWGSLIVLLASTVTTITTLSMCAICTNGEVKGGGAYFLISRSLGPEFGGSIGVIFSVANAVAAAMYVVGFAETVRDLMKDHGWIIIDNDVMDIRIIGLMTCTLLMAVVFVGTSFESRMQIGLLAILSVSIINFWVGTFIPVTETQLLRGVTGYSLSTLATNMLPAWRGEDFFSVFAVYFPAATGIMAGANISGDLADPQMAIPKGTLLSIAVTTLIYLSTVWITGATCVRDATGLEAPTLANDSWKWIEPTCAANETCEYGLLNYFQVIQIESGWGPLITAGIFAATLSSALASLVSAPKVFQAVSKDHLFPYIQFFAKGYGKDEEPRRAYGLGFSIAMLMILIGDLNAIAPIISNFFLASYALINYACFAASFTDSPGFRPSFSYYNMWVSLGGALLCLIVMFIISWWTALITYLFFIMLFMYIHYRKPEVNWGTSTQAQSYKSALQSMLKLVKIQEHVKNYRPQLLVLTGNPIARPSLVDFVNNITKGSNLMICGHVIPYAYAPPDRALPCVRKSDRQLNEWLQNRRVKAFYVSTLNPSLRSGVQTLLHVAGLGKLRPNIVIIGFKSDWAKRGVYGIEDINEYFGIIQDVFGANMGMGMLRNSDCGFDFSELMEHQNASEPPKLQTVDSNAKRGDAKSKEKNNSNQLDVTSSQTPMDMRNDTSKEANAHIDTIPSKKMSKNKGAYINNAVVEENITEEDYTEAGKRLPGGNGTVYERNVSITGEIGSVEGSIPRQSLPWLGRPSLVEGDLLMLMNQFQRKVKLATIDVWWLYDDGGLTLLIPHLLTLPRSYLENAKLRVFTIASSRSAMEQEHRCMAALLGKFRIEFTDIFVIPDFAQRPSQSTLMEWDKLIAPFRIDDEGEEREGLIKESALATHKERTHRHLRCRELLLQHSSSANLIVMTLPIPRKGTVSSCLYMSWLDMLTKDLPPTLLIRGNQTSVLTFYS